MKVNYHIYRMFVMCHKQCFELQSLTANYHSHCCIFVIGFNIIEYAYIFIIM